MLREIPPAIGNIANDKGDASAVSRYGDEVAAMSAGGWRHALAVRAGLIAFICAAASLSAPLARVWPSQWSDTLWLIGLASHWQWIYMIGGGVFATVGLVLGRAWACLPLAVIAIVWSLHSASIPHAERGTSDASTPAPRLTVATANLHLHNPNLDGLRRWLLEPDGPDVVFLQEFTDAARRVVSASDIRARYPYQLLAPASDPFGLAILSRHSFASTERLLPDDEWRTLRLRAVIEWRGQPVALSAVHPMPPVNAQFAVTRDAILREEADWLDAFKGHGVLAGDLNDTPWSTGMVGIEGKLRRATGLTPTWPNAWGWLSVLPIDHVLATKGWKRLAAEVGPDLGSDHRPVVVGLSVEE